MRAQTTHYHQSSGKYGDKKWQLRKLRGVVKHPEHPLSGYAPGLRVWAADSSLSLDAMLYIDIVQYCISFPNSHLMFSS